MKRRLAWAVSRVFDPVVEIPILLAGSVYYALVMVCGGVFGDVVG